MCPPDYHHNDFMASLPFCKRNARLHNTSTNALMYVKLPYEGFMTHRVIRECQGTSLLKTSVISEV